MKKFTFLVVALMFIALTGSFAAPWAASDFSVVNASATLKLNINLDGTNEAGEPAPTFGFQTSTYWKFEVGTDSQTSSAPHKGIHGFVNVTGIGMFLKKENGNYADLDTISTTAPDTNSVHRLIKSPGIEAWIKFKPYFITIVSGNWWGTKWIDQRDYTLNMTAMVTDHAILTSGVRAFLHTSYTGWAEGDWWGFDPGASNVRNKVGVKYNTAGAISFGYDSSSLKWNLKVGTESATGGNAGDGISFGGDLDFGMVANLSAFISVVMGVNYGDNEATTNVANPIGIGARIKYDVPLGGGLVLIPSLDFDGRMNNDEAGTFDMEMVPGVTVSFPGFNGPWGNALPIYEIYGGTEQSYTGFMLRMGITKLGDADTGMSIMASLSDTGAEGKGLIDKLGIGAVFELINMTDDATKSARMAFGLDYEIRDVTMGDLTGMIIPHFHVNILENMADPDNKPTVGIGFSVRATLIPQLPIQLNYTNSFDSDSTADPTKGTISITATATL